MNLSIILLIGAFICLILDALGKCPSWVWGLLVVVWALLQVIPVGR